MVVAGAGEADTLVEVVEVVSRVVCHLVDKWSFCADKS